MSALSHDAFLLSVIESLPSALLVLLNWEPTPERQRDAHRLADLLLLRAYQQSRFPAPHRAMWQRLAQHSALPGWCERFAWAGRDGRLDDVAQQVAA